MVFVQAHELLTLAAVVSSFELLLKPLELTKILPILHRLTYLHRRRFRHFLMTVLIDSVSLHTIGRDALLVPWPVVEHLENVLAHLLVAVRFYEAVCANAIRPR